MKACVIAIIIALVFSFAPFGDIVPTTHAQSASDLGDVLSIPIQSLTEAAQKYAHTGISAFGIPIPFTSLDSIMKLAVKQIIEQLQKQIVGWVTGGGKNGNPIFETNLGGFLTDLNFKTGTNYLTALSGSAAGTACSYFKKDLVSGLSNYFKLGTSRQVANSLCSAERKLGKGRVQTFLAGDFQGGGGWDAWSAITQNDDSNAMGSYLRHQDQIASAMASEESIQRELLDQGHGFHAVTDAIGNIVTPGAIISDQINQTLSSNLRQLELSKNFDDIVTVLANSLINQLITGAGGLLGAGKSQSSQSSSSQSSGSQSSASQSSTLGSGKYLKPKYPSQTTGSTSGGSSSGGNSGSLQNAAIGGTATQSSTLTDDNGLTHDASLALTGSKNRNPKFGGVAITTSDSNPWWQVDLKNSKPIDHIDITPRINDGYGSDLTGFYVIISENPIVGNSIPVAGDGVWVSPRIAPGSPRDDVTTITPPAATIGRYVRIQEDHTARLEIAGVQIFAQSVPILSLIGDNPFTINRGGTFEDPGAVAIDQNDGDISSSIGISGSVNSQVAGTYTLRYSVTNSAGISSGVVTRTVIVQ